MVSVQVRKEQASYAVSRGISQRRACTLLSIGRSSLYYSFKMPMKDAPVIEVWCYDFVYDACANGQKLKCLTVIDEYTRECLAIDVNGAIRSSRVIDVLRKLM